MAPRRSTKALAGLAAVLVALSVWVLVFERERGEGPRHPAPTTADPVERGCDLDADILERIERGHFPGRSEDITYVPYEPNYLGSFDVTSHSGPWDYLQRVPLVLYGPERVQALGAVSGDATLADVHPTIAEWTGADLEPRGGNSFDEALRLREGPPRLMVFVMWDGAGRNVLERWPDAWPTLARLEREGTTYPDATVGSSPSITPATHATLGTGAFPSEHGLTAIKYRGDDGTSKTALQGRDPRDLELSTFADEIDRAFDNEPKVGLVGWRIWHIPMMGHGAAIPDGDKDQLALIGLGNKITGNRRFYDTPPYVRVTGTLQDHVDELDRRDGESDEMWRGHPIAESHDNPAWVAYQNDIVLQMWQREGYGDDEVPDMFFINYKMTDVVGHQYSMDSPEMEEVLRAQDDALRELVDYLEAEVEDYALVVSADHGSTPPPEVSGGWPISPREMTADVNAHFDIPEGSDLMTTTAVGAFVDPEVAADAGVSHDDIARFLNGYTIGQNWAGNEPPEGYENRGDEPVFEAAFPSEDLDEILACAAKE